MTEPLAIAVSGPAGRLGSAILRAAAASRDVRLTAGLARPGSSAIGMDLGAFAGVRDLGVKATDQLEEAVAEADVLIDVSTGSAAASHAHALAERGGPALIVGATGETDEEEATIAEAAKKIPIVEARNFSLGVALMVELSRIAAKSLGEEWDIEILEMHHRAKTDAPSGTALVLGNAVAEARNVPFDDNAVKGRAGGLAGPRQRGEIGVAALRGGGVVGDHDVIFAASDSMLTISHRAHDRSIFANGALAAAKWVKGKPPGLYGMRDVLGLGDGPQS